MILEVDNVELSFASKKILNEIYLKAKTGEVVGILGSNGTGKSSLLSIIFGNLKPKYKLIRIDKNPILIPLYQTCTVKYLPQYNFIPKSIKLKNVFKAFKVDLEEFLVEFNSFSKYKNGTIKNLSGGECRVIETYLIIKSPSEIVLLDEPFSHIAPLYIEHIVKLIKKEKMNKIFIVSDHNYEQIINISNSLYLLKNGYSKLINSLDDLENYNYLNFGSLN